LRLKIYIIYFSEKKPNEHYFRKIKIFVPSINTKKYNSKYFYEHAIGFFSKFKPLFDQRSILIAFIISNVAISCQQKGGAVD
jgi:hypothetical protein